MSLKSIFIRKIVALLNDMDGDTARIMYGIAAAIYYYSVSKKSKNHIDGIRITCYNGEKEQVFDIGERITERENGEWKNGLQ